LGAEKCRRDQRRWVRVIEEKQSKGGGSEDKKGGVGKTSCLGRENKYKPYEPRYSFEGDPRLGQKGTSTSLQGT